MMTSRDDRKKKQFWIDREGKCHKYKGKTDDVVSIHYTIARTILPDKNYPDDELMKMGWVMVGSSVYNCPIVHRKPTQAQIRVLKKLDLFKWLCFLYKDTYPNYEKYGILCGD